MGRKSKLSIEQIYDVRDKIRNVQYYVDLTLNRTLSMFNYSNLPDTIPEIELEKILQLHGYGIVTEHKGDLVALWGGFAPPLDVYYRHTNIIVANPWAKINKTFQFYPNLDSKNTDAVLIKNDPLAKGLLPIFKRYGTLLTEADITLYLSMINLRTIYSIMTNNDDEKESAEIFLKLMEEGKQGVMMQDEFGDGIKVNPYSNSSQGYITQLIELEQYLKGSFFNDIGLNSNYNMKRERLNSSEVELNEDGLRPLIDSMLEERQKAVDEINKKYGTNISVEFGSSWEQYNEDYEEEITNEEQENEPIDLSGNVDNSDVSDDSTQELNEENVSRETIDEEQTNEETIEEENNSNNETNEVEEQDEDSNSDDEIVEETQEDTIEDEKVEVNIEINSDTIEEVNTEVTEEQQEEPVEEVVEDEVVEDDTTEETTEEDEEDKEDE